MIPIEKNISVIDENGNEYEATYPKRARGLVKKGRARFVDDNTICLACPPDITEDTKMSDNTNVNVNVNANEETLNVGYILKQMAAIQQDNAHIYEALKTLTCMQQGNIGGPGAPGDISGQAKATAIADVVKCRETTNQKLLAFYEKVYDDLVCGEPLRRMQQDLQLKERAIAELINCGGDENLNAALKILGISENGGKKVDSIDKAIDDAIERSIEKSIEDSIAASIAIGEAYSEN